MKALLPLKSLIETGIDQMELPDSPGNLYDPWRYFLKLGGKRIRPILTILAAQLFDPEIKGIEHKALAMELFHNFTLMHDDIMDEAPLRRNKETVHKKWGTNIGILSGDALLIKSYQYLIKEVHPNNTEILNLFNRIALEVCEGQQMDLDFEEETTVTEEEYIEMIRLKTAVLLGCSLEIGAIAAYSSKEDAKHLYNFGENIGIAFQLQDDYLDAFSDTASFGKQIGGDILANKKTYLLIRAIEKSNEEQREAIFNCFNIKNPTLKVEIMLNLYRELKIVDDVQEKMNVYYKEAIKHLNSVSIQNGTTKTLKNIAKYFLKRIE
jgi:geranylgeranyl diphosphate synthase type II